MYIRVYFQDGSVKEFDLGTGILRMCDDHGRVLVGEPWPKKDTVTFPAQGREPTPY